MERNAMALVASMALLSLGGGFGSRARVTAAGPETPEQKTEREARRKAREEAQNRRIAEREATIARLKIEPVREDFPSRQTYRAAHRTWSKHYGTAKD